MKKEIMRYLDSKNRQTKKTHTRKKWFTRFTLFVLCFFLSVNHISLFPVGDFFFVCFLWILSVMNKEIFAYDRSCADKKHSDRRREREQRHRPGGCVLEELGSQEVVGMMLAIKMSKTNILYPFFLIQFCSVYSLKNFNKNV